MLNTSCSYSQIINPKNYNKIMSKQHLYMAAADCFAVNTARKLATLGSEVVEIGCGPARILSLIAKIEGINITGVDLDDQFLEYAQCLIRQSNVNFIKADVETYRHFKEVDIFVGHGVHHHITKGLKTSNYLKNIYNNLKEGGYYILTEEIIPITIVLRNEKLKLLFGILILLLMPLKIILHF